MGTMVVNIELDTDAKGTVKIQNGNNIIYGDRMMAIEVLRAVRLNPGEYIRLQRGSHETFTDVSGAIERLKPRK